MFLILLAILCLTILYLLVRPVISGAIYFPTKMVDVQTVLHLADTRSGRKMVDLGSGDGRLLIAFAKAGLEAHGYEINPLLVLLSRRAIKKNGLDKKAFVYWKSFWKAKLGDFDVVVLYQYPQYMARIEKKIKQEMKPGSLVISNIYKFPSLEVFKMENRVRCYRV